MFYFGAQINPEIWSRRLIFNTPLKVAQTDMSTKTDSKPEENFW